MNLISDEHDDRISEPVCIASLRCMNSGSLDVCRNQIDRIMTKDVDPLEN